MKKSRSMELATIRGCRPLCPGETRRRASPAATSIVRPRTAHGRSSASPRRSRASRCSDAPTARISGRCSCILDDYDKRRDAGTLRRGDRRGRFASGTRRRSPTRWPRSSARPRSEGVGRAGGFKLMVEDRGDNKLSTLQGQTDNLVQQAKELWLTDSNALIGRGKRDPAGRPGAEEVARRGEEPGRPDEHGLDLPGQRPPVFVST